MVTLGYTDPVTGVDWLVEVGVFDEERLGYWAIRLDPETRESVGGVFFASMTDLW